MGCGYHKHQISRVKKGVYEEDEVEYEADSTANKYRNEPVEHQGTGLFKIYRFAHPVLHIMNLSGHQQNANTNIEPDEVAPTHIVVLGIAIRYR